MGVDTVSWPTLNAAEGARKGRNEPPIVGTWIASPAKSTRHPGHQNEGLIEAVYKKGEQILGRGAYEVSADGKTLSVSTKERTRKEQMKAIAPVDYVVEFEEIKVLGDYAYEWGTYWSSMRPRAGGETISYRGKLMRILQRQPDGTWKMHRTMMTNDPPSR